ncbi:pyridoxal phosphate-dependent aminotransferase [Candidatus Omnitrophota bacterium]
MARETLLSKRVAQIPASLTLSITSKAKEMRGKGLDVINFGAGEPDFDTPANIKQAAIQAIKKGFTKYTPSCGTAELKKAISEKLKSENSLDYDPSQIIVSCGAKHSIYNIIQAVCSEQDEVIIPAPYWLSYPEMVKLALARPVFAPTFRENGFKVTKEALEAAISDRTKVFILNSPSNPTGAVCGLDELKLICELAVKHDFLVVSDEIYEQLIYDNKKHVSIAALGRAIYDRTIVVNGVSKAYSMTGWRIGYAAGPAPIIKGISNLQSHSTSNPCSISQMAALSALTDDASGPFVEKMRAEFQERRNYLCSRLDSIKGLSCAKPEGAFYVFADISQLRLDSITLANLLLEESLVAVVPGAAFGDDKYVRLSFATSMDNIKKGMDRLEAWVDKRL